MNILMDKQIKSLTREYERILDGEPWFGPPVYKILRGVDPSIAFRKPNENSHSLVEILYHMLTWTEFTLSRLEEGEVKDVSAFENLDWREIDPQIHGWEEGLSEFIATNQHILAILNSKDDAFLSKIVDHRNYNVRFLIKGIMQHHIYHAGQVAYLNKLF